MSFDTNSSSPDQPLADQDWVEVHNSNWLHEAQFLASVLDAAGIESMIPDQYTVGVQPFYTPLIGGIRILVHARDLERAHEVLLSAAEAAEDTDDRRD